MLPPRRCIINHPKPDTIPEPLHLWLTTRAAAVNLVRLTNLGVTHNNGAFTL